MESEKIPNWPEIERDYRAGVKTLRAIAQEHGISEGAIRKRAKRDEWARDLTGRIEAQAQQNLLRETARSSAHAAADALAEKQLIAINADVQSKLVLSHREDIQRARRLCLRLLGELEEQTEQAPLLEELADVLQAEDPKGMDKRAAVLRKVISLSQRATSLKTLADALKVLIALEREAFGMSQAQEKEADGAQAIENVLRKVLEKQNGAGV